MFHLKEVKSSINCISSSNKLISYNTKQEELFIEETRLNTKTTICGYFFSNRFFVFSNNVDYTNSLLDLDTNIILNLGKLSLQFQKSDNEFVGLEKINGKRNLVIFDILSKSIKTINRDIDFGIKTLNANNLIVNKGKTTLRSLSLLTGEYEWEVDLGEKLGTYDSIAKIVCVVDDLLWVISQRGILFGIEINTGELLYHLNYDNVDSFKEIGNVSAKYFHSLFDEANKKFIGIYRTQYWEIDLTNPTTGLQVFDLEAINPTYFSHPDFYFRGSYWAAPEGVTFDNDYIYFRDIEVATVGILHRQTKKIEWHTRLNDQEPMVRDVINDVQVSENKLYVLDTGGNLHIFEKETS